jgi:hypothetical protein
MVHQIKMLKLGLDRTTSKRARQGRSPMSEGFRSFIWHLADHYRRHSRVTVSGKKGTGEKDSPFTQLAWLFWDLVSDCEAPLQRQTFSRRLEKVVYAESSAKNRR